MSRYSIIHLHFWHIYSISFLATRENKRNKNGGSYVNFWSNDEVFKHFWISTLYNVEKWKRKSLKNKSFIHFGIADYFGLFCVLTNRTSWWLQTKGILSVKNINFIWYFGYRSFYYNHSHTKYFLPRDIWILYANYFSFWFKSKYFVSLLFVSMLYATFIMWYVAWMSYGRRSHGNIVLCQMVTWFYVTWMHKAYACA